MTNSYNLAKMLVLLFVVGIACATDELEGVRCANGGTYLFTGECKCDRRFTGARCEIEPCINGGFPVAGLLSLNFLFGKRVII